jgi:serine/threonine-protein kinase
MIPSDAYEAPTPEELSEIMTGFKVGPMLAAGPHSAVYSAIQISLDRQVALRVYPPAASSDPERVSSVEATTRAMARLKHPNLIGLFDSGTREGMIYVVMEFVAGKSLSRSLGGYPIHHAQARSIIAGVCDGLAHAHHNQIAHGKLTADDILLNSDAEPKIGSFQGLEFKKGEVADIVAVGRILYQMLTGMEDSPRSVEPSVLVGSPKELDEIWSRCTHRDSPDAFVSVEEIVQVFSKPRAKTKSASPAAVPRGAVALAAPKPAAPQSLLAGEKLPLAVPAATARPPLTTAQPPVSQWTLVRNVIIMIVLVIAIMKVWGMMQRQERMMQRQQQAEQARVDREAEMRRQEAIKKRLAQQARIPKVPQVPHDQVPNKLGEIKESSLHKIRRSLMEGKRKVLPVGSVRRADSVYLLVRDVLSWPEAHWFAERHGACLAIPDESADLTWLLSIAEGEPFWLGAAKSGRSSWRLVDGRPWQPTKEPVGLGRYLGADKHGFLRAVGDQVRLPFILQWKMDGSHPGLLEPVLSSTAESLSTGDPVYPPGIRLVAERAYLVVARDVDWKEANRLAVLSGGHLAVVSDAAETVQIGDLARYLPPDRLYWLGASRTPDGWRWVTGEPWRDGVIGVDEGMVGGAIAVSSPTRWQAVDGTNELNGFLIEWSRDAQAVGTNGKGEPEIAEQASNGVGVIDAQAKRLLQTAIDKRKKDLKANASKMESDLTIVLRNMPGTLQRQWTSRVQRLKEMIVGVRVPESIDSVNSPMNEDMVKIVTYAISNQQAIDYEFSGTANQVREAYQKRLRDIMTKALQNNERQTVVDLKPKLDASERLDSWVESLGISLTE